MKVRMVEHREGGWHDGTEWRSYPPVGGEMDVPDEMGADLCRQGAARPVAQKDADVETRKTTPAPQKRAQSRTEASQG